MDNKTITPKEFLDQYGSEGKNNIPYVYDNDYYDSLISPAFNQEGYTKNVGINISVNVFSAFGHYRLFEVENLRPYIVKITTLRKEDKDFPILVFAKHQSDVVRFVADKFSDIEEIKVLKTNSYLLSNEDFKKFSDNIHFHEEN